MFVRVLLCAALAISCCAGQSTPALYVGGGYLYRSLDAGRTWSKIDFYSAVFGRGTTVVQAQINAIAIDPTNPAKMILSSTGTDNLSIDPGLYTTLNSGATWSYRAGLSGAVAIDPFNPSVVLAGPPLYKSTDGGRTFKATSLTARTVRIIRFDPRTAGLVYAMDNLGIYKSTDDGDTWSTWAYDPLIFPVVNDIQIDPNTGAVYIAGGYFSCFISGGACGIGKFTNDGKTFTDLNLNDVFLALALDPHAPGHIIAGGSVPSFAGHVVQTRDDGKTWVTGDKGLTTTQIAAVLLDPATSQTVYIAGSGDTPLYKSTDGGQTWTPSASGIDTKTLNVLAAPSAPTASGPIVRAIVNAASFSGSSIAPGEIVVIFGAGLGPAILVPAVVNGGSFPSAVAGVQVTLNGIPAPIIYTRTDQTAVIVPYGLSGATTAQLQVSYNQVKSLPVSVAVRESAPSIFTSNSSGIGQAAALNQDGSLNSAQNPARPGSIISIYATGEGQTSPPGIDGKIALSSLPKPLLPVTVLIGGQPAEILYEGAAPSSVAGLMQINARIPTTVTPSLTTAITLEIGGIASQQGVTVAVVP